MSGITFEWDSAKNRANQRKHGVSLEEARSVFFDPQAVEFYDDEHSLGEVAVRGHIALPDELVRKLQIPFFRAELEIRGPSFRNTDAGKSVRVLRKNVKWGKWPEDLGRHLMNILSGLDDVVWNYTGETERFPAFYILKNYVEQIPNPDSRIGLASSRDALGLNRLLGGLNKVIPHSFIFMEIGIQKRPSSNPPNSDSLKEI